MWISKKQYCSFGREKNIYDVPDIRGMKIRVQRPFHVKFESLFLLTRVRIMNPPITMTRA